MIYILYGPDTYRSRKKLNEIIAQYQEKAGNNFNFHRFDLTENRAEDIKCVLESGSLFEAKKLVVIEYAFVAAESFPQIKSAVAAARHVPDTILILCDGALDNAGSGRLKEIQDADAKSQEFRLLAPREFKKWLEEEAGKRGGALK